MPRARRLLALAAVMVAIARAAAAAPPPDCEALAEAAGREAGLPAGLLPAIARVESAKSHAGEVRAWPWTLNEAGEGMYFDTRQAALAHLRAARQRGVTNIDVGCMQINYHWHGERFPSLEAMLDPAVNTAYAAAFLRRLHARHGNWRAAAAAYHSTTPKHARRYLARLETVLDERIDAPEQPRATAAAGTRAARPPTPSRNRTTGRALVPGMSVEATQVTAALPAGRPPQMPTTEDGALRRRDQVPLHLARRWRRVLDLRAAFGAGAVRP
ncbi:lytic transglycosylase domain-containing protein [Rhodosalinus sediminis]|uniref:lytic transglycosylase domain-containing protein n=1 Tax=Rhodosalinus sediminis TaxID=1940533 RepID=UPI0023552606|nr:lytic transglycosylase domain-containing protein [Rhodosalinus sediminis]